MKKNIAKTIFSLFLIVTMVCCSSVLFAQQKVVTGTVVNGETNEPIANASVKVKETSTGINTDSKGLFNLSVAPDAILEISSVGFQPLELAADFSAPMLVKLQVLNQTLSDVVVVGYGSQKKINLVGAVSTVKVDDKISGRALPNISSGLSGMVPGLSAVQNSGMAGNNGASLMIRGLGTVNNAEPLIVVDGMPDVDINRININDIETVTVLKDATSASVYGSRAANGVILITTKSGKGMRKTQINFASTMAVERPTRGIQFMNDHARAMSVMRIRSATNTLPENQVFKLGTIDQWMAMSMIDPLAFPDTDWWNVIMQDGHFRNYNLSATGGSDKSNFFMSVGMKDQQGLQINNKYKQYNARFNFDYKLRENMNAGVKFNGNWSNFQYSLEEGFTEPTGDGNTAGQDLQYASAGITPYDPVTGYYGGTMAYGESPQAYNPYTIYMNNLKRNNRQEVNTIAYMDWSPVKGLKGTIEYGLNYYNQFAYQANTPNRAYNFQTKEFGTRIYVGENAGISNTTNTGYKTLLNGRLNYQTTIADNHDISALFVYSEEYWYQRSQFSSRDDRLHPSLSQIDAALRDIMGTGGSSSTEGLRSYIGRVNYAAFGKYLLEGNFRVDGSSRFLPGSQYGFFPSVAVGWRFTQENFMNDITGKFLSNGKIRLSYGELGNNSGVGRFEQQATLTSRPYIYGGVISRGFVNRKMINQHLTWESTSVLNLGIELGFLQNRLTTEIDLYDRKTTGMNRPSEMSNLLTGAYSAPRRNIGDMRNRGIEGTFSWKDKVAAVNYGLTMNVSYNQTELESWNEFLGRGTTFIGMPYGFVYSYEDQGLAQTWQDIYNTTPQGAKPGDILFKDLNGDGRIDGNDRKAYPNAQMDRPTTFASLIGFASWKGFDVGFMLNGTTGRKDYWLNIFNNPNFTADRYAVTWDHLYEAWSLENRDGTWPRLGGAGDNENLDTHFWLDDMSYVRLKNVQLGYTFSSNLMKRAGITSFRVAGSAENIWTLTNYRGVDPEKAGRSNDVYPINKSYSLVLQLGF